MPSPAHRSASGEVQSTCFVAFSSA